MEEKPDIEEKNYIKILNKEKVLEFKNNNQSGYDESEIIIQNISNENIISKIYINNYKNYKCIPNIIVTSQNSISKIKVTMDNKDYTILNSDIFLIISHPVDNSFNESDPKMLNEYFKNNGFKEKGQKIFLVAYKEVIQKKEKKDDELIKKIHELEKEVFDDIEEVKTEETNNNINNINKPKSSSIYVYLVVFGVLVFFINSLLSKLLKK